MKVVALICVSLLVGCHAVPAVDRLPPTGMVQLYDGGRKVGWLAAYHTDVSAVDGGKPVRRFIYGDREEGAILLTPGRHVLQIRLKDSTHATWAPIVSDRSFTMTAIIGSVYDVRFENGELVLYRWPDMPDGPRKLEQMKKEPNQAPDRTAPSVTPPASASEVLRRDEAQEARH